MTMTRLVPLLALSLLAAGTGGRVGATDVTAPLELERTIPLPGVSGRIDHMALDPKREVLFIGEVGAGAFDAVDLKTGKRVARVEHLEEPQGVAYLPAQDQVAVASGGDGTVRFYSAADLKPVGQVQLDGDADNLRVAERSGLLVAADSKGFSVIDPAKRVLVSKTFVGGHPEGFRLDSSGDHLVANIPDQRRIVSVDLKAGKVTASWGQGSLMNFPMALNGTTAAAVFRAPSQLLVFDSQTGKTLVRTGACGDSDDLFFDAKRPRLYVSCGAGEVQVFDTGGGYRSLGSLKTRSGARTSLFAPSLDRLFVAARASGGEEAAILVLKPKD
jgi:DNA-binding beta-propeller fold protein YncE